MSWPDLQKAYYKLQKNKTNQLMSHLEFSVRFFFSIKEIVIIFAQSTYDACIINVERRRTLCEVLKLNNRPQNEFITSIAFHKTKSIYVSIRSNTCTI